MNKRRVVDLSQISGFDLEYRPHNYFWAADLNVPLSSSIAGETRRQMVRAFLEWDTSIPEGLDAEVLDDAMREAWGHMHPSHMGGEYLPQLRKGEVEIARISLASVTADQVSVRARRVRGRIGYRIVDEYPQTSRYVCHPARSDAPLSLRELVTLMESASEGGSIIFPILAMNMRNSAPDELGAFITVTSDLYADLGRCYHAMTDSWLTEQTGEDAQ